MSRSNPNAETSPHPAKFWLEWSGKNGNFTYYDKVKEAKVEVPLPVTFLLLDELSTVKGWHDSSESGIYSNEVRNTNQTPLTVKAFKGGTIAEGLYKDIKDKIANAGGHYSRNLYVAVKINGVLELGSIMLKGAALSAWFEFSKVNRGYLDDKAVAVKTAKSDKKGAVTFLVPEFVLQECSDETNKLAFAMDCELQKHLERYLQSRTDGGITPPVTGNKPELNGDMANQFNESQTPIGHEDETDIPF